MKKVFILVVSILCVLVCSCSKYSSPTNLLIGSWEVAVSIQYEAIIAGSSGTSTLDGGVWYYTFEEDGQGRAIDVNDASIRFVFSYQYDDVMNSILLKKVNEETDTVMEIESLTKDSFILHSEMSASIGDLGSMTSKATYKGTRIK